MKNILLIGGTGEAVQINKVLSDQDGIFLITSLAGRTQKPTALLGEVLPHGFSEHGGLEFFLKNRQIDLVIDASHPFAEEMSRKAFDLCYNNQIPLIRYDRLRWEDPDDNWINVDNLQQAAEKISLYKRIFLTVGRQELKCFKDLKDKFFLIRSIEDIDFNPPSSNVQHVRSRGPFSENEELALMRDNQIDVVVSKNSGGAATFAKITAARVLSIPVVMVKRPPFQAKKVAHDLSSLLQEIRLSF